jgi:hypothetical protein
MIIQMRAVAAFVIGIVLFIMAVVFYIIFSTQV